jgi:hypothetical protein
MADKNETGLGGGTWVLDNRPSFVILKLVNFNINSAALKEGHTDFIETEILPFLRSPTFVRARLTGMTSRTGGYAYDMGLGQRRADSVQRYLFTKLSGTFKSIDTGIDKASLGNTSAIGKSDVDGADDRAVLIEIFLQAAKPTPPRVTPPPPPPPTGQTGAGEGDISTAGGPIPEYVKKGSAGDDIPMFRVPGGSKMVRRSSVVDNTLSFEAGSIVDCVVTGVGVQMTISEGPGEGDKRTARPIFEAGITEEYSKFGEAPIHWNFSFELTGGTAHVPVVGGLGNVICYSDWIKGMPVPFDGRGRPRPRTP